MATDESARSTLKKLFVKGARPTAEDFYLIFDSFVNVYDGATEDEIGGLLTGSGDTLNDRLSGHDSRLDDHTARLDSAELTVNDHGTRLGTAESDISGHDTRLDRVDSILNENGGNLKVEPSSSANGQDIYLLPTTNGNIGLGTNDPQTFVDITQQNATLRVHGRDHEDYNTQGTIEVYGSRDNDGDAFGEFRFYNYEADYDAEDFWAASIKAVRSNPNGSALVFSTSEDGTVSDRLSIVEDGKVGIGTDAPEELVHVRGDNATVRVDGRADSTDGRIGTVELCGAKDGDGNSFGELLFCNYDQSAASPTDLRVAGIKAIRSDTDSADVRIQTANNGTLADHFTVDYSGQVGIGTVEPSEILDIRKGNGVLRMDGRDGATSSTQATISLYGARNSDGNAFGELRFHNYDANGGSPADFTAAGIRGFRSGTEGAELRLSTAKNGTLADRLTIDPDGQVGIATTDPQALLHLRQQNASLRVDGRAGNDSNSQGSILTYGARGADGVIFGELSFYNYSNQAASPTEYLGTRISGVYSGDNGGELRFGTAKDGTLTDHLTISDEGAVNIGSRFSFGTAGDFAINGQVPIVFERYEGIGDNLNYDTGYSVEDYNAAIIGYLTAGVNINEGGSNTNFIRLRMQVETSKKPATWKIRADLASSSNHENWSVDVMFVSRKMSLRNGYSF
ncbi:MAG: hypothetical protein AAGN35_23705 [Bacteroidota bacterium]